MSPKDSLLLYLFAPDLVKGHHHSKKDKKDEKKHNNMKQSKSKDGKEEKPLPFWNWYMLGGTGPAPTPSAMRRIAQRRIDREREDKKAASCFAKAQKAAHAAVEEEFGKPGSRFRRKKDAREWFRRHEEEKKLRKRDGGGAGDGEAVMSGGNGGGEAAGEAPEPEATGGEAPREERHVRFAVPDEREAAGGRD